MTPKGEEVNGYNRILIEFLGFRNEKHKRALRGGLPLFTNCLERVSACWETPVGWGVR
jgi:hypothetical protein